MTRNGVFEMSAGKGPKSGIGFAYYRVMMTF